MRVAAGQAADRLSGSLPRLDEAGWDFPWPSWLPWPLRLPVDHVLTRGHLVVTTLATGTGTDSDQLPVVAAIGWRD